MKIDLNADLAEGSDSDGELMTLVSSVNIACGLHAGGPDEMVRALELAKIHGVRVGAHPGFADRENFGRKAMNLKMESLRSLLEYQLGALLGLACWVEVNVAYVKPHGALYHLTMHDREAAWTLLITAKHHGLAVMGLPKVPLERWAGQFGVPYLREGFADRRYLADGSLAPRGQPDAMVRDPILAARQARRLVNELRVQSICVHGDEADAVSFTTALRQQLLRDSFVIAAG